MEDGLAWHTWIWMPLVTALIGWLTNWVAIRMLFHPREPVGVGSLKVQGLIPRRQEEIAGRIADIVQQELLGKQFLRQQVEELNLEEHAERAVIRMVRGRIGPQIRRVPMLGRRMEPVLIQNIERIAVSVILEELNRLQNDVLEHAEKQEKIREIVQAKILGFDLKTLESLVIRLAAKEFRQIEVLGAVLGYVVGLAQIGLLSLTT
ncbi:MAG: DUF445 domain-containing protein [Opitutales bacterium]